MASERRPEVGKEGVASSPSVPISLSIPETAVEHGLLRQQTVYYVVVTRAYGQASSSRHTFEEFETLHSSLAAKARYDLPPLPPTYWYGNDTPEIVQERQRHLESLLQQLLLVPDALADGEESLLRFLQLPKATCAAVRFVLSKPGGRTAWLRRIYESTAESGGSRVLRDAKVDEALLGIAQAALADITAQESSAALVDKRRSEAILVCELFARAHRCDKGLAEGGQQEEDEEEVQEPSPKSAHVKVLLGCMTCLQAEEGSGGVCPSSTMHAAAKALLTLARAGRGPWSSSLWGFLDAEGVRQLTYAVDGWARSSGASGEAPPSAGEGDESGGSNGVPPGHAGLRVVVELLLRGFEADVVARFLDPHVSVERKRMLNHFFMSQDPFVRLIVGLLLARLVCDAGHAEAAKAQVGVQGIYEELIAPEGERLQSPDGEALLSEEGTWLWLCTLAKSSHATASGFALLTIAELVRPSPERVLGTPGLCETLRAKLSPELDLAVRGPAARLMLGACRGCGGPPSAWPAPVVELSAAVTASVEASLQQSERAHSAIGGEVSHVQGQHRMVSVVDVVMQQASSSGTLLNHQIRAWGEVLSQSSTACSVAQEAHVAAGRCLSAQRVSMQECGEQVEQELLRQQGHVASDSALLQQHQTELAMQEASFAAAEARLKDWAEVRIALTRKIAEWEESAAAAQEEEPAEIAQARGEAAETDDQMRLASEELPAQRTALQHARQQLEGMAKRRGDVLETFGNLLQTEAACGHALQRTTQRLREVHGRLQEERSRRQAVREAMRDFAAVLYALDEQIEALDQQETCAAQLAF